MTDSGPIPEIPPPGLSFRPDTCSVGSAEICSIECLQGLGINIGPPPGLTLPPGLSIRPPGLIPPPGLSIGPPGLIPPPGLSIGPPGLILQPGFSIGPPGLVPPPGLCGKPPGL
jgi:hypothetical protein